MSVRQRVAVVSGSWSHEANYSSVDSVSEALDALGYEVIALRYEHPDFLTDLLASRPDMVFPQVLGAYGEDGGFAALLERYNLPYVGSGLAASAIGMNKALTKVFLRGLGLPGVAVPASLTLSAKKPWPSYQEVVNQLGSPVVLKPLSSGASFGLHLVTDEASWQRHLFPTVAEFQHVLAEQYVRGREFASGILEDDLQLLDLPVCEILAAEGGYSQEAKCQSGIIRVPAQLEHAAARRMQEMTRTIFHTLGCRSFVRIDLMLADDGTIFVLELNTLPGLLPDLSAYPKMCQALGLSYEAMIRQLLQSARKSVPFQMPKLPHPPARPVLLAEGRQKQEAQKW